MLRSQSNHLIDSCLDHFDRVPDHFILGVLWYLNKYDLTNTMNACRRFKYIGYARRSYLCLYVNAISTSKFRVDPKLWKFLNLQGRPISESALHTIIDRKIRILRLFSSSVYCLKRYISSSRFHSKSRVPYSKSLFIHSKSLFKSLFIPYQKSLFIQNLEFLG